MRLYVKEENNITPSSFQLDFTQIPNIQDTNGPHWLSFEFWLLTSDVLVIASSFTCDVNWVDSTGVAQVLNGTPFSLGIPQTGRTPSTVIQMSRETGSSLWTFDTTLIGGAGSSKVGYRIMHTSAEACDISTWD